MTTTDRSAFRTRLERPVGEEIPYTPPPPKPANRDRVVAVRFSADEHVQLRALAKAQGRTVSDLLREVLVKALAEHVDMAEASDAELLDRAIKQVSTVRARLAG